MKKLVVSLCLLVASLVAQAQFEEGKWIVNPSLTGVSFSHSQAEKTNFGFQAQGGAFLVDNVALMITAGADWSSAVDTYALGVGGRYYIDSNGIYLGSSLKMKRFEWDGGCSATDYALGLEAGYAYFITQTITIEPAVYYDLSFKDSDYSKFGIKVGFGLYF